MNILFLCVGNSGRSQIAEGLAKDMLPKSYDIRSAGSNPAKNIHSDAIFVMDEIGIDISSHKTKSIESLDKEFVNKLDHVITLCAEEVCPFVPSKAKMIKISPSILNVDDSKIEHVVENLDIAGADYIHIDVMDGHFVPNISMGPSIVKSVRGKTSIPFDVHLMIDPIEPYIDDFIKAGADIISIHPEANDNIEKCIDKIKSNNVKAGLAINPDTNWEVVIPFLDKLDIIVVMSVHPGFGGQKFIPSALEKLKLLRKKIDETHPHIELEIDGGVNFDNIDSILKAGANVIVAGTTTFTGGEKEYANNISKLRG